MIILIAGSSHTGKTKLAQSLLEKYNYPYLSTDHLKMGLIRSKNTDLTVYDDEKLEVGKWFTKRAAVSCILHLPNTGIFLNDYCQQTYFIELAMVVFLFPFFP